ncbi:hypothetical protein PQX77_012556 [Marasmius sp. AFHP31]|nr:hypothetical protein PQX77_012556 [Marasmius sp. AFHP31]
MSNSTLTQILTALNHTSAPFISTFALIHLTAPTFANVGGSEMASQVMILGREYYQTSFGEKYLLLGPIVIHTVSGITKRLLSPRKSSLSLLQLSAYPLLLLLPMHFLSHRYIPSLPSEPISSLGPSELDYQFVVYHLRKFPILSWTLYSTLLLGTIVHAAEGAVVLWNSWKPEQRLAQRGEARRVRLGVALLAFGGPVLSGVYILSRELPFLLKAMSTRFDAVFERVPGYQLGL